MKIDFEKLKKQKQQRDKAMQTDRFQNIAHFFDQKGLLKFADKPKVIRKQKIAVIDILWAMKYEPRILEVFPAAYIHFKSKFIGVDKIPSNLNKIIEMISKGEANGEDYKGIRYEDMKRWANISLKDTRTKPINEQKKLVSFKFEQSTLDKLMNLSLAKGISKTQVLEQLIELGPTL